MTRQLKPEDYTIGWVCASPPDMVVARELLDEEHEYPQLDPSNGDHNVYAFGSIARHNIVITLSASITNQATAAVAKMLASFKMIRYGLSVGIGGGVPSSNVDIRLGDVVVGSVHKTFDMGKVPSWSEQLTLATIPPRNLLNATTIAWEKLKIDNTAILPRSKPGPDLLFQATYDHEGGSTCEQCNMHRLEIRQPRESKGIVVHHGKIASGVQIIKTAAVRDELSNKLGSVLCFETEAADMLSDFQCLVIRGISNYADSHKSNIWEKYAAEAAAAFAKEILLVLGPAEKASIQRDVSKEDQEQILSDFTMEQIRRVIRQHPSSRSTTKSLHSFLVQWDIQGFINSQYNGQLQDVGHMLAITGNSCNAQLTTVEQYIKQTWPSYPDFLLNELQLAVLGTGRSYVAQHGML